MKPEIQIFEHVESSEGYDIHAVMKFIGDKYNIDCYDFYNSLSHFDKWADEKGYKEPEGKKCSSNQIWYAEYIKDPKGDALRPPYKEVMTWYVDKYMPDQNINEMIMLKKDFVKKKLPEHIKIFSDYVFAEFGENVTLVLIRED